ncbi:MAG: PEP-CTERM sorting domain-containing protein [Planctomycetia bacterium]|nr:PEP-CTERM sorting domain-containing protein [Planctomycetia bacterium]
MIKNSRKRNFGVNLGGGGSLAFLFLLAIFSPAGMAFAADYDLNATMSPADNWSNSNLWTLSGTSSTGENYYVSGFDCRTKDLTGINDTTFASRNLILGRSASGVVANSNSTLVLKVRGATTTIKSISTYGTYGKITSWNPYNNPTTLTLTHGLTINTDAGVGSVTIDTTDDSNSQRDITLNASLYGDGTLIKTGIYALTVNTANYEVPIDVQKGTLYLHSSVSDVIFGENFSLTMRDGTSYIPILNDLGSAGTKMNIHGNVTGKNGANTTGNKRILSDVILNEDAVLTVKNDDNTAGATGAHVFNAEVSGAGKLVVDTLFTSGDTTKISPVVLSAENSYTGGTEVKSGILRISSAANLGGSTGTLTLSGGSLNVTNATGSPVEVDLDTRPITITSSSTLEVNADTILKMQNITGAANQTLTKIGAGRLDISGALTAGNLAINAGTFSPGNSIGTTTLQNGNFSLAAGSTLLFEIGTSGDTFDVDDLNVTGEISFADTSAIEFSWDNKSPSSNANYTLASATAGITNYDIFDWDTILRNAGMSLDSWSVTSDANAIILNYTGGGGEVPEPSTWFLLLLGGACLIMYRRVKK